jgi:hypothetical protein
MELVEKLPHCYLCGWVLVHEPTPQERKATSRIDADELQYLRAENEMFLSHHANRRIPVEMDEEDNQPRVKKINYPDVRSCEPRDVTKKCKWCGIMFPQIVYGAQRRQDYCSEECRNTRKNVLAREKYAKNVEKGIRRVRHYRGVLA